MTAALPVLRGADATPASDLSRAVLAVTPRTDLPPEADDPNRPSHLRLLKPGVWTDDAGVDDLGNIYNQYRRSAFGTWSNYDEAIANPFPLTDPLLLKNGQPVNDAATWWGLRRPEILADFYTEIYGRMPEAMPKITWEVTAATESGAVKTKTIVGHIDNSAFPEAVPAINLTLTLPAHASGPVPVMVVVSSAPIGAPRRAAATGAGSAPSGAAPVAASAGRAAPSPARGPGGPSPLQQVLDRGWGYATFNTASVQADNGGGLTQGIIGLMNRGQPRRRPDEWGALTAWTWGLSRVIDYFETDRDVDAKRLGVEGHSRWGKTALWAAAQDPRWAIVFTSCSGEGGAKPSRRNYGETTDNIAGSHWMAANYRKYGGHWNDLPVDAPELIALVAPRPVFITGATQDPWADPRGEFRAAVAAGPVYRLLGKNDLGTAEMPAPDVALTSGDLAFREHVGPHTDVPDWPVFLDFAAKCFAAPPALSADGDVAPWNPDCGDGTYRNPVLFADYSDPDAIRVGDDFYLVASSFQATPGLPILHSKDLVNWTIINHALPRQVPDEHYSLPRHGEGVWAPALRYHGGKFWITYPDPDFGLYLITAQDPAGEWSTPVLVKAGKGLIDPCPFWDDDGQMYLIHAWANSRAGISNRLTLHQLSPDGTQVLDAGTTIIDGAKMPGWRTIEGPKLYRRHDYYYVFAPAGGVTAGYQAVFRAKNIYGPYESRVVIAQGSTPINGPHQGAWVDTTTGENWFLHFQQRRPTGRVVHLQPMVWRDDDWPVMGSDPTGVGKGVPVLVHAKPNVGRSYPVAVPQTSDEFDGPVLGLQWQWNANPRPEWAVLDARPGFLRLASVPASGLSTDGTPAPNNRYDVPNLLLQKFPAPEFTVTTALQFTPAGVGEIAGLVVFGFDYAVLGERRTADGLRLVLLVNRAAGRLGTEEHEAAAVDAKEGPVFLRVTVGTDASCRFAYSYDNQTFTPIGQPFPASGEQWTGAKVGLFASALPAAVDTGHADFDWFRVRPNSN